MSVVTEIERLQGLKTRFRTKLVSMLGISSAATLEDCVSAIENVAENGGVSATLDTTTKEYTVPAGHHNGNGKVNIVLESKTVTPTVNAQTITPVAGKVLDKVVVDPIPGNYGDVSSVDATAEKVLSGVKFVDNTGALKSGSMTNNGAVTQTINGTTVTSYTIPEGFHNGKGTVSLDGTIEAALAAL